jgi:hypothetical protein
MAIVRLKGLGKLKKVHLIGTRTRDLLACSIVSQPTMLPRACPQFWRVRNEKLQKFTCYLYSACLPVRMLTTRKLLNGF